MFMPSIFAFTANQSLLETKHLVWRHRLSAKQNKGTQMIKENTGIWSEGDCMANQTSRNDPS